MLKRIFEEIGSRNLPTGVSRKFCSGENSVLGPICLGKIVSVWNKIFGKSGPVLKILGSSFFIVLCYQKPLQFDFNYMSCHDDPNALALIAATYMQV